jgi:zona occludens toxin (predicted ATPase)
MREFGDFLNKRREEAKTTPKRRALWSDEKIAACLAFVGFLVFMFFYIVYPPRNYASSMHFKNDSNSRNCGRKLS